MKSKKPTLGDVLNVRFNKKNNQINYSLRRKQLKNYGITPQDFLKLPLGKKEVKRRLI